MKWTLIFIAAVLVFVTGWTPEAQAQTWKPVDGDAVLKGIAEETNGVRLIRVLPVSTGSGGAGSDVNVLNWPVTQEVKPKAGETFPVSIAAVLHAVIDSLPSVTVGNWPAVQATGDATAQALLTTIAGLLGDSLEVRVATMPAVTVSNLPAVQTVQTQGSVSVDLAGQLVRTVVEAIAPVVVANWPAVQTIAGSVGITNLPAVQTVNGEVNVGNWPAALPVTGDFYPPTQPVSGTVNVGNFPAVQPVSGTVGVEFPLVQEILGAVNILNWPAVQTIAGTVAISGTSAVEVDDEVPVRVEQIGTGKTEVTNWPATQPVSGGVDVTNWPAAFPITAAAPIDVRITDLPVQVVVGTVEVMPEVNVANFPVTQETKPKAGETWPVSIGAAVHAIIDSIPAVDINNWPATQAVTGTFWQAIQPVSGTVAVSNLPATQEVEPKAGSVWSVAGTFWQAIQPVSGTVNVGNWPAAQAETGDFYPPTQPVSGTVGVNNFPAVQTVAFQNGSQAVTLAGELLRTVVEGIVPVVVSSLPAVTFNGTQPVEINDEIPVRVQQIGPATVAVNNLPVTQEVAPKAGETFPVSVAAAIHAVIDSLPNVNVANWPVTQAVTGTFWQAVQPVSGTVSLAGTTPVLIDDAVPVRTQQVGTGTVTVANLPATQAVTPAGTFPVAIAPETPVRVYATDTLPVAVVYPPQPVKQRWAEIVNPTVVNGAPFTVTLTHVPAEATITNLSDTYEVTIARDGAEAGPNSWRLRPGQAHTFTDGGKILSVYGPASANPASFQIYSVYEIELQ